MKYQIQLVIALCLAAFIADACAVTYLKIFFELELFITKAERVGDGLFSISQGEIVNFPAPEDTDIEIENISNEELYERLAQKNVENGKKTSYLLASAVSAIDITLGEELNMLQWNMFLPNDISYNYQKQVVIIFTIPAEPLECSYLRVDTRKNYHVEARYDDRFILLTTGETTAREELGNLNTVFGSEHIFASTNDCMSVLSCTRDRMIMDKTKTDLDYKEIEDTFLWSPTIFPYIAIDQNLANDDFLWWELSNGGIVYTSDKFAVFSFVIPPKLIAEIRFELNENGIEGVVIKHNYKKQLCITRDSKFKTQKEGGRFMFDLQDLVKMKQLQIYGPKKTVKEESDSEHKAKKQKTDSHDWNTVTFEIVQTPSHLILNYE